MLSEELYGLLNNVCFSTNPEYRRGSKAVKDCSAQKYAAVIASFVESAESFVQGI